MAELVNSWALENCIYKAYSCIGADAVVNGINSDGYGAIVNSSRGIDYAYANEVAGEKFTPEEFAEAALEAAELMRMDINDSIEQRNLLPW